jgi:hypothetical protein
MSLPGTNTLAYFAVVSATKKAIFLILTNIVDVIKLFFSLSLTMRPNKLGNLSQTIPD